MVATAGCPPRYRAPSRSPRVAKVSSLATLRRRSAGLSAPLRGTGADVMILSAGSLAGLGVSVPLGRTSPGLEFTVAASRCGSADCRLWSGSECRMVAQIGFGTTLMRETQ